MKIVISPRSAQREQAGEAVFLDELRAEFPDMTFERSDEIEEQKQAVRDADIYYGWPTREVFLAADRLRWIQCPGTGIDELTRISELVESDVVVTNCRGPHAPPMADHVMGMVINLAHLWGEMYADQRLHRWDGSKYYGRQVELSGSTMGILALGDIGSQVARRAHGFGMKVYAVDSRPGTKPPEVDELWGLDRLDEMMAKSDWFVVTAPYSTESKGMIDRRRIELLKDGANVIVISRGGIVDEDALIDGLKSGHLAGAGLDVLAEEPLSPDSPLWDMDNVVITPHASALTPEMGSKRKEIFKENLRRFLANEPFLYV
jgi:phosphoglycerate dehydrogenase-like enzyme